MRRIATPDEIFDILDNIKGKKFATIGYVTGANLDMPKVKKINPETNRMKSYDDYSELGKRLGYEDEIGGIVKLSSYTLQLSNRKEMADAYSKFKQGANDIRAKYGIPVIADKEKSYTDTVHYGVNGVSVYGGENDEKTGHVYHPANIFGITPRVSYYIVDKEGNIDRECDKSELKEILKKSKYQDSGVTALTKMGAEDELIKKYIDDIASLKMNYKNFEYSSILYIVATVKGEKLIYINTNMKRAIGQVNVNASQFMDIVRDRYKDDLEDIPNDTQNLFEDIENTGEINDIPFMTETEDLDKAITLMGEALKQYEDGKYSLAAHSRKAANEYFDKIEKELSSDDGAEKYMYGESRNFGLVYHVIEENARNLYETKEGRKTIAKLLSTIKNNDTLIREFRVYDALTRPVDVDDPETYVNEMVNVIDRVPLDEMAKENSKLISKIKTLGLNENIVLDDETVSLCEAIEYAMTNKPSMSNVKEFASVKKTIAENVKKNRRKSNTGVDLDSMRDEKAEEIANAYEGELNEDEKSLIKDIALSESKALLRFNEVKENLLSILDNKINESEESDKAGWNDVRETVLNKKFDKTKVLNDIADMVSLQETII